MKCFYRVDQIQQILVQGPSFRLHSHPGTAGAEISFSLICDFRAY